MFTRVDTFRYVREYADSRALEAATGRSRDSVDPNPGCEIHGRTPGGSRRNSQRTPGTRPDYRKEREKLQREVTEDCLRVPWRVHNFRLDPR